MHVSSGFQALLVATQDKDWKTKWDAPAETTPKFLQASRIRRGEDLYLLIFFANPKLDISGTIHVSCDIKVIRPDGSASVDSKNISCMDAPIHGPASNIRLGDAVILFSADEGDPYGDWRAEVKVRDEVGLSSVSIYTEWKLAE